MEIIKTIYIILIIAQIIAQLYYLEKPVPESSKTSFLLTTIVNIGLIYILLN